MKTTALTPLAAAGAALAGFACCVPLGLVGAYGIFTLSFMFDAFRPWFMGLAVGLLAVSAVQAFRGRRSCRRSVTRFSVSVLGLSAAIVVLILVFPQTVAGWLADYYISSGSPPAARAAGVPPLAVLNDTAPLKAAFNRDSANTRVIALLSPTCPYCLTGASSVQRILANQGDKPITVFVVWEPILPTDWSRPLSGALRRFADPRVRQYWDASHIVAAALKASAQAAHLEPGCCVENGVWWDMMAAFPPGAQWTAALPAPLFADGIVEDTAPALETLLTRKN